MKPLRTFLFCCAVVAAMLLSSCTTNLVPLFSFARFSSPVTDPIVLSNNMAILYGRFETPRDFSFGNKVAVQLRNEDLHTDYLIECLDTNSVYGVAVKPGNYRLTGFVATFVERRVAGQREFKTSPIFNVAPNAMIYVGDVNAFARLKGLSQEWGIQAITNNYASTTDELRRKYPSFGTVQTVSAFDQLAR